MMIRAVSGGMSRFGWPLMLSPASGLIVIGTAAALKATMMESAATGVLMKGPMIWAICLIRQLGGH